MRAGIRQSVRVRYEYRCGYCGIRESDAGARLTLDHFQPRAAGGDDEIDNLVYCCHACNEYKGDYWSEEEGRRLLHPLRDDIAAHLDRTQEGKLRALTERGSNHIERLKLNRSELVAYRLQRQQEDILLTHHQQILQLLETLKQDNQALREQIAAKDLSQNKE